MERPAIGLRKKLRIGTWNVRSLYHGKLHTICNEMERTKTPILGITEHRWAGQGHFKTSTGDTVIYSGKEKSGQSGVGFILAKKISTTLLGYNPINDRLIMIRLQTKNRNITLIQAYAPTTAAPDEEIDEFYQNLQETIDKVGKRDILIIMGDFNAKVGKETAEEEEKIKGPFGIGQRNERGAKLIEFCLENNLCITNTLSKQHPRRLYTWTSPDGNTRNQIDYILVQRRWITSILSVKTLPGADCDSDHELLVADYKLRVKTTKKQAGPIRFDTNAIPLEYNIEIQNKFDILMAAQEDMTPDELATQARDILISTAQNIIPRKVHKKQVYITEKTLKLIEERRKLKRTGLKRNSTEYKNCSREVKKEIRKDKKQHIVTSCNKIDELRNQGKEREMYNEINIMTRDFSPSIQVINDNNGKTLTEKKDVLERWREYCRDMYEDTSKNPHMITTEIEEKEPEPMLDEVRLAIKSLKRGKSPGCDDIPAELIQAGGEASVRVYHKLCTKIWNSSSWPKEWKRSLFIPIPKKGNLKLCTNYRTIALISHASKILLRIIMKRMEQKLEDEIHETQAGFRKGRGTRDHICSMRLIIEKCREYNVDLHACFIDYSKAFDHIQHQKMWNIMKDMHFPAHIIQLIEFLYHEQQATIKIGGEIAEWFEIQKGVRQGCILSPYLFNVYAENIMRNVKVDANYENYDPLTIGGKPIPELRYADDTVLLSTSKEGLENLIMTTKKHSEDQHLYLNTQKTKIMSTDKAKGSPNIQINNEELQCVESYEYLGSIINNNGDCSKEISRRLAIAIKKLNTMKNMWQSTSKILKLKILRTCIFPVATYGCESWTITQKTRTKIQSFETKCYRKILRIPWTEKRKNTDVLKELNVKENWLINNILYRKIRYFGHIKRHDGLERTILEGRVPGRRGRGRPRRRWLQDIKETMNMTINEVGELARDRVNFRCAAKRATSYKGYVP